jgi:hypothetical protein
MTRLLLRAESVELAMAVWIACFRVARLIVALLPSLMEWRCEHDRRGAIKAAS